MGRKYTQQEEERYKGIQICHTQIRKGGNRKLTPLTAPGDEVHLGEPIEL